jgi:hypothetical protein
MTFASQHPLRDDLVTKLKTITLLANDTDTTPHVVGYFETNPKGISPFACVDSAGALYGLPEDTSGLTPMRFVIGVWVRRDDPATAEDQINDLALSIAQILEANYNAKYTDFPQSDFEEIEGVQYKFELHFVEIDY